MRLVDKVAIVTGAASGIGRASAVLFAREGAKVAIVDIDAHGIAETLRVIESEGGKAECVVADVSKEEDTARIADRTSNAFGRIDILFNNAAVSSFKSVIETDESEIDRVMNVNVKGMFFCSKAVIPHLHRCRWRIDRQYIIDYRHRRGARDGRLLCIERRDHHVHSHAGARAGRGRNQGQLYLSRLNRYADAHHGIRENSGSSGSTRTKCQKASSRSTWDT